MAKTIKGSTKNDPIGIFDSGIGGLTVANAIHKILPNEQLIYFGDTAHFPYGEARRHAKPVPPQRGEHQLDAACSGGRWWCDGDRLRSGAREHSHSPSRM